MSSSALSREVSLPAIRTPSPASVNVNTLPAAAPRPGEGDTKNGDQPTRRSASLTPPTTSKTMSKADRQKEESGEDTMTAHLAATTSAVAVKPSSKDGARHDKESDSADDELFRLKSLLRSQSKRFKERAASRTDEDMLTLEQVGLAPLPQRPDATNGNTNANAQLSEDSSASSVRSGKEKQRQPRHVSAIASASSPSLLGSRAGVGYIHGWGADEDGDAEEEALPPLPEMAVRSAGAYYLQPEERRAHGMRLLSRTGESADESGADVASVRKASQQQNGGGECTASSDEEARLTSELAARHRRIQTRATELKGMWERPPRSVGSILPPEPRVLTATTEVEVRENAAAAEAFAKSQIKLKKRLDAQSDRRHGGPEDARRASSLLREGDGYDSSDSHSGSGSLFGSFNFFGSATQAPGNEGAEAGNDNPIRGRGSHFAAQGRGTKSQDGPTTSSNHKLPGPRHSTSGSPDPRGPLSRTPSHGNVNERSLASLTLGRMSMASCSVARVTDGALAVMEMLANRPDVVLPSPAETSVVRTGDVLSAKHILKLDLQDALRSRTGPTGIVAGAPYFRIVPKLNIAGVAQANISAIRTIINELRRAHVEGPVIWVNLREEPLVYINNQAHIVRARQDPLKPVIIPNVTGRSIEAVEAKLKDEVLQESYENGGNISVHVEGKNGLVEDQWECADAHTVYTMKEVFQHLALRSPASAGALHYFRRPITQNVGPQPSDFDFVLDACLEEPKAVFVFNCQTGRGRTSAMMQIANIVRFYQLCVKDVSVDVRVLRGITNTPTFRTIQKLVSLFPDGKLHERRLNILMDLADKVYSMADHISEAFSGMDEHPEEAVMRLQQYALFLVFSYYCEQRLWNYTVKSSFAAWLADNGDMRLLIDSLRDKLKDQLKAEQILTAAPPTALPGTGGGNAHGAMGFGGVQSTHLSGGTADGVRAEPAAVAKAIRHRRGNVLSAGRILCSVPMATDERSVRALRQLAPDVPIFTCGRMSGSAREELVREIRESFPRKSKLHWLSLRAEPMVFINDVSYTLTDSNAPLSMTENGATMHVSVQAIEQIEDRLRRDVLLEAQEHGGYVIVHHLDEHNNRTFTRVKVCSVRTPKSTMEDFVTGSNISYCRVPIPFSGQMLASDIDPLLRFLEESDEDPHDVIVINDSEGSTRTSVALNMLVLHRAARLKDLRGIQSTGDFVSLLRLGNSGRILPSAHLAGSMPVTAEEVPEQNVEPLVASTICQMLTAGSLLRTVDAAIALSGRGVNYNILHRLDHLKRRIGVVGVNKPQCILDAIHCLRSYLLVLLTTLYLDDPTSVDLSFSQWVREHSEVCNIVDNLEGRGEAALKYVASDNLMKADVSRRSGDVLTANFCLKADHFPGCQKKGLRPELCGAPNFRKVNLVNVYGVAIPTQLGIHNILSLLGASNAPLSTYPGQNNDQDLYLGFAAPRLFDPSFKPEELQRPLRGSVVWVNLREEPILYVGDRPFVFRDLAAPYVNVELTGIQTDKIEIVETRLKADVLSEAQQYGGKFLVHDEGTPGELVGQWEPASDDTVKTLREVYDELEAHGARCLMLRLPVTDEQSPDIGDFDLLVAALLPRIAEHLDRRETLSFVFNCQMGRGRTTTGMVICCLLIGLAIPEYYEELHNTHNPLYLEHETDLWRGDYEVISQLKRVLTQGRSAKYKVDLVLEECSKMQNLRTAIESFAVAEKSPDNNEAARARAHHAGVHYLIRYFNLIVFAVYLDESYDRMRKRMRGSFVDWMQQHPELTALAGTAALK